MDCRYPRAGYFSPLRLTTQEYPALLGKCNPRSLFQSSRLEKHFLSLEFRGWLESQTKFLMVFVETKISTTKSQACREVYHFLGTKFRVQLRPIQNTLVTSWSRSMNRNIGSWIQQSASHHREISRMRTLLNTRPCITNSGLCGLVASDLRSSSSLLNRFLILQVTIMVHWVHSRFVETFYHVPLAKHRRGRFRYSSLPAWLGYFGWFCLRGWNFESHFSMKTCHLVAFPQSTSRDTDGKSNIL